MTNDGKNNDIAKEQEASERENGPIAIDFGEMYKFDLQDMSPEISVVRYSNVAYIQITHRDVYIDFLEMPGVKKGGDVLINGTRIYMTHAAAQKLAVKLGEILESFNSAGHMEKYQGKLDQGTEK